jgi:hypothetical protein
LKLQEFIEAKKVDLEQRYREVEFHSAEDVQLSHNSCSESFLSSPTDLFKEVKTVRLSELPENRTAVHTPNGSKIRFAVKAPRKRKFTSLEFFVLWEV